MRQKLYFMYLVIKISTNWAIKSILLQCRIMFNYFKSFIFKENTDYQLVAKDSDKTSEQENEFIQDKERKIDKSKEQNKRQLLANTRRNELLKYHEIFKEYASDAASIKERYTEIKDEVERAQRLYKFSITPDISKYWDLLPSRDKIYGNLYKIILFTEKRQNWNGWRKIVNEDATVYNDDAGLFLKQPNNRIFYKIHYDNAIQNGDEPNDIIRELPLKTENSKGVSKRTYDAILKYLQSDTEKAYWHWSRFRDNYLEAEELSNIVSLDADIGRLDCEILGTHYRVAVGVEGGISKPLHRKIKAAIAEDKNIVNFTAEEEKELLNITGVAAELQEALDNPYYSYDRIINHANHAFKTSPDKDYIDYPDGVDRFYARIIHIIEYIKQNYPDKFLEFYQETILPTYSELFGRYSSETSYKNPELKGRILYYILANMPLEIGERFLTSGLRCGESHLVAMTSYFIDKFYGPEKCDELISEALIYQGSFYANELGEYMLQLIHSEEKRNEVIYTQQDRFTGHLRFKNKLTTDQAEIETNITKREAQALFPNYHTIFGKLYIAQYLLNPKDRLNYLFFQSPKPGVNKGPRAAAELVRYIVANSANYQTNKLIFDMLNDAIKEIKERNVKEELETLTKSRKIFVEALALQMQVYLGGSSDVQPGESKSLELAFKFQTPKERQNMIYGYARMDFSKKEEENIRMDRTSLVSACRGYTGFDNRLHITARHIHDSVIEVVLKYIRRPEKESKISGYTMYDRYKKVVLEAFECFNYTQDSYDYEIDSLYKMINCNEIKDIRDEYLTDNNTFLNKALHVAMIKEDKQLFAEILNIRMKHKDYRLMAGNETTMLFLAAILKNAFVHLLKTGDGYYLNAVTFSLLDAAKYEQSDKYIGYKYRLVNIKNNMLESIEALMSGKFTGSKLYFKFAWESFRKPDNEILAFNRIYEDLASYTIRGFEMVAEHKEWGLLQQLLMLCDQDPALKEKINDGLKEKFGVNIKYIKRNLAIMMIKKIEISPTYYEDHRVIIKDMDDEQVIDQAEEKTRATHQLAVPVNIAEISSSIINAKLGIRKHYICEIK